MFLLIVSFSTALLWPIKAGILDRLLLAVLCFPLLFIGLNIAGLPVHSDWLLDFLALLLLAVALRHYRRFRDGKAPPSAAGLRPRADFPATLLAVLLFLLAGELQYAGTGILPAHDPIAVPSIARQIFLTGNALLDHFAPGSYHSAYPPGYPILVSLFYAGMGETSALLAFKHLNILVVACIPVLWAWYLKKVFAIPSALFPLAIAFYCAYFFVDRNLPLVLSLAGKNATLCMGLFFPCVFYYVLRAGDSWWAFAAAIAAALALAMIHYAAIGMLLIALLAYFMVQSPLWRKANARPAAACLAVYLIALGLLVLFLCGFERPGGPHEPPVAGVRYVGWIILDLLVNIHDRFFFIFDRGAGPAPPAFRFRGLCLLVLLGAGFIFRRRLSRPARALASGAAAATLDLGLFAGVAVILCVLFTAALMVSVNGYADYVRWLSLFFYSTVIASALALLWEAARSARCRAQRLGAGGLLAVIVVLCACGFARDCCRLAGVVQRVPARELAEAAAALKFIEEDGAPANLIAMSTHAFVDGRRAYFRKTLDYIPALSPLRLATGSWMYAPQPGANDLDSLPGPPALAALWSQGALYFIGTREEIGRYSRSLPMLALESFGPRFGALSLARVADGTAPHRLDAALAPAAQTVSWRNKSYAGQQESGGVLDALQSDGARLYISGWAADRRTRRIARVVLVFRNAQPLAEMRPQDFRTAAAGPAGEKALPCGFFGIVPAAAGVSNAADVVAYALYDTGNAYPLRQTPEALPPR